MRNIRRLLSSSFGVIKIRAVERLITYLIALIAGLLVEEYSTGSKIPNLSFFQVSNLDSDHAKCGKISMKFRSVCPEIYEARRASNMNQSTENQPTFNTCNSSW